MIFLCEFHFFLPSVSNFLFHFCLFLYFGLKINFELKILFTSLLNLYLVHEIHFCSIEKRSAKKSKSYFYSKGIFPTLESRSTEFTPKPFIHINRTHFINHKIRQCKTYQKQQKGNKTNTIIQLTVISSNRRNNDETVNYFQINQTIK